MKKNISSVVGVATLVAMIFVVTGCNRGKMKTLRTEKADLTNMVSSLRADNATLTNRVGVLQTNYVVLTNVVAALRADRVDLDKMIKVLQEQNEILKPLNAALTNHIGELQSTNLALARQVAELNTKLTNALAAVPAAQTTAPAAATYAPTNAVIAVVQSATNTLVFYQDGTITTTNAPVGMVGGLPVLVDNVSRRSVSLTIKRLVGRGSIAVDVDKNSTYPTVFLLRGQYACTWRIKGNTEVAGSATLTVNDGDPAELVVGKGVFSATLTLADQ